MARQEKYSSILTTRVSKPMEQAVKLLAKADMLSVATFLRRLIRDEIARRQTHDR